MVLQIFFIEQLQFYSICIHYTITNCIRYATVYTVLLYGVFGEWSFWWTNRNSAKMIIPLQLLITHHSARRMAPHSRDSFGKSSYELHKAVTNRVNFDSFFSVYMCFESKADKLTSE